MSVRVMNKSENGLISDLLRRRNDYTPDYLELKKFPYHKVFVYGTLKRGHHNHGYIEGYPYLGKATNVHTVYEMFSNGGFPVVLPFQRGRKRTNNDPYLIGEVYVVPTEVILELDRLEANGRMYDRKKMHFFMEDQHKMLGRLPAVDAFCYVGCPEYWENQSIRKMATKKFGDQTVFSW